ncbi:neural proliferation differentiation and control protein 1 isoform X1 [Xenopus laevis]|uniref:Neural proliferation differentiation and control protein 1 isoform X1 n=1 Tax=Xenopus laevis TaxID=8355 RepID=A0A8J0TS57_XENLA|nr:neural proliferation differentiation and control protein 1 isoform X1 [Xenopus laevis]
MGGHELYIVLLLLTVTVVEGHCPPKITCILKKREMCTPGGYDCGPCRSPYMETASGKCILQAKRPKFTGPDAIIDFLQNMLNSMNEAGLAAPSTTVNPAAAIFTSPSLQPLFLNNSTMAETMKPTSTTSPASGKNTKVSGRKKPFNQNFSLTLIVICSLTGVSGIVVVGLCWYRLQKEVQLAQKSAYTTCSDRRQHICHRSVGHISHYIQQYQNKKQQLQAQERSSVQPYRQLSTDSEPDTDDCSIYECPGLAPTGEMEVHNPLFDPVKTTK